MRISLEELERRDLQARQLSAAKRYQHNHFKTTVPKKLDRSTSLIFPSLNTVKIFCSVSQIKWFYIKLDLGHWRQILSWWLSLHFHFQLSYFYRGKNSLAFLQWTSWRAQFLCLRQLQTLGQFSRWYLSIGTTTPVHVYLDEFKYFVEKLKVIFWTDLLPARQMWSEKGFNVTCKYLTFVFYRCKNP